MELKDHVIKRVGGKYILIQNWYFISNSFNKKKKKAHPESYGKQVKQVVDFGACANRNVLNTLT